MKIKSGILLIIMLLNLSISGCKALDSLLPKEYNQEIGLEKQEGRYLFQVNYDPQYTRHVYLDNVHIKPGVKYYVKEGKYWFRYTEEEKYRIALLFSRNSFDDDGGGSGGYYNNYETVRRINMVEDKVINIKGNNCRIEFQVGKGWK